MSESETLHDSDVPPACAVVEDVFDVSFVEGAMLIAEVTGRITEGDGVRLVRDGGRVAIGTIGAIHIHHDPDRPNRLGFELAGRAAQHVQAGDMLQVISATGDTGDGRLPFSSGSRQPDMLLAKIFVDLNGADGASLQASLLDTSTDVGQSLGLLHLIDLDVIRNPDADSRSTSFLNFATCIEIYPATQSAATADVVAEIERVLARLGVLRARYVTASDLESALADEGRNYSLDA